MEPPVYYISKFFFVSPENAISIGQITHVWSSLLLKNHGCAGESRRPTKLSIPQSGSSESSESSASRRPSPRTGRDDLRNFTWKKTPNFWVNFITTEACSKPGNHGFQGTHPQIHGRTIQVNGILMEYYDLHRTLGHFLKLPCWEFAICKNFLMNIEASNSMKSTIFRGSFQ